MSVNELKNDLQCSAIKYIFDAPMSEYTTFKLGGNADILSFPKDIEETIYLFKAAKRYGVNAFVIGNGSNLLVRDGGIRGIVIKTCMTDCSIDKNIITAGAGVTLAQLAKFSAENGLAGLEFASGIPGTLGGGIFMNAGAYKHELQDVVIEATAISREGTIHTFDRNSLDFSYRHSCFNNNDLLIVSAKIQLEYGEKQEIFDRINELSVKRRNSQPLEYASAGSTFKRPANGYAAAMIDEAGLKGYSVGDAQVSEKHAGFLINKGHASAKQMLELISDVQNKVYEVFGVMLETEVRILGED